MNKRSLMKLSVVPLLAALFASCAQVKEYQKSRVNDSEMVLANRKVQKNELNAQSYREGSSGANGGKTGGGCGCN
jgi:beta-lactam-binding protein with PASTA domain